MQQYLEDSGDFIKEVNMLVDDSDANSADKTNIGVSETLIRTFILFVSDPVYRLQTSDTPNPIPSWSIQV